MRMMGALTPYINAEVMPNLTAILEAHPEFRAAITQAARKGAVQGSTKRAPSHSAPTAPAAVSSRERLFASRSGTAVPSSFVR